MKERFYGKGRFRVADSGFRVRPKGDDSEYMEEIILIVGYFCFCSTAFVLPCHQLYSTPWKRPETRVNVFRLGLLTRSCMMDGMPTHVRRVRRIADVERSCSAYTAQ
uniref:Pkinase_Tyr domain-containing protein n=1 Tax=Meloidogyne hapla TaxID=6305 RepID=A0A1I8BCW1_MELHA